MLSIKDLKEDMRKEKRLSRALLKDDLEKSTVGADELDEEARNEYADFISARDPSGRRRSMRFIEKAIDNSARLDAHENGADRHPIFEPIGLIFPSKKESSRERRTRLRALMRQEVAEEDKDRVEKKKAIQKRRENKALKRKQALAKKVVEPKLPIPASPPQQTIFSNLVFRPKPADNSSNMRS